MRRLFATAAFIAFALPAAAFAQSESVATTADAAPAVATAPVTSSMVRSDVAGIQRHADVGDTHSVDAVAASTGLHQGQGMALMVVGGAAMVGGLIIGGNGGTAVALGGLAVGLVGLYQYVR